MQLLYFAWVRERIGKDDEDIVLPVAIATVGELLDWLATRSPAHAAALADRSRLRVAVNQVFADDFTAVAAADEVAIFPPVTGG
ncbi:MAG: molybdopterin converting factor subunit 1 [Polymorphobacter sp.]